MITVGPLLPLLLLLSTCDSLWLPRIVWVLNCCSSLVLPFTINVNIIKWTAAAAASSSASSSSATSFSSSSAFHTFSTTASALSLCCSEFFFSWFGGCCDLFRINAQYCLLINHSQVAEKLPHANNSSMGLKWGAIITTYIYRIYGIYLYIYANTSMMRQFCGC